MKLTVPAPGGGDDVEFECEDDIISARVCDDILRDHTYPSLPFLTDVRVVVDAGANCGAFSVYSSLLYPDATVHAVEPGRVQGAILHRNAAPRPTIVVHDIGLSDVDQEASLYQGRGASGLSSITPSDLTVEEGQPITLRHAGRWAAEQGIERIDVLKVDVEGCEIPVLESLAAFLPDVQAAYVEYGSRQARRDLHRLLDPSHDMFMGSMLLDQGECVYLRRDLAALDAAPARLLEIFARELARKAGS